MSLSLKKVCMCHRTRGFFQGTSCWFRWKLFFSWFCYNNKLLGIFLLVCLCCFFSHFFCKIVFISGLAEVLPQIFLFVKFDCFFCLFSSVCLCCFLLLFRITWPADVLFSVRNCLFSFSSFGLFFYFLSFGRLCLSLC